MSSITNSSSSPILNKPPTYTGKEFKSLNLSEESTMKLLAISEKIFKSPVKVKEMTQKATIENEANEQKIIQIKRLFDVAVTSKPETYNTTEFKKEDLVAYKELTNDLFVFIKMSGLENDDLIKDLQELTVLINNAGIPTSDLKLEIENQLKNIGTHLTSHLDNLSIQFSDANVVAPSKIFSSYLEHFKLKALCSTAAETDVLVKSLIDVIESPVNNTLKNKQLLTKEARREIFQNLKYLESTASDFVQIQKVAHHSIFSKTINRSELKQLEHSYQELRETIKDYYKTFAFGDDEIEEFQKNTIDAMKPIRKHLMNYALDFIEGARQLAIDHPVVIAKLENYKKQCAQDPRLGNNNEIEPLSENEKIAKHQMEEAKSALKELVKDISKDLVKFKIANDTKAAGKLLFAERGKILIGKDRWGEPIDRVLTFEGGNLSSQLGKKTIHINHSLGSSNSGYASSLNRNREKGIDCIAANAHEVSITDDDGELSIHYLTSATPVEFSQVSDSLRKEATKQQSMELLLSAAKMQLNEVDPMDQVQGIGTEDSPFKIDFTAVGLLSPDPIRDFMYKHPQIAKFIGKISKKDLLDPSKLEKKILQETIAAMKELQEGKVGEEYEIKDRNGNTQKIKCVENGKGELVYAVTSKDEKGNEQIQHFKFDVTYFDFGTNKFKQMMLTKIGGNEYENQLNQVAWNKLQNRALAKLEAIDKKVGLLDLPPDSTISSVITELENKVKVARDNYLKAKQEKSSNFEEVTYVWSDAKDQLAKKLDQVKQDENPNIKAFAQLMQRKFDIMSLNEEVADQFSFKDYLTEDFMKQNAYSMASGVATLVALLKQPLWTACRSGKDRTSLQRMEIAVRVSLRKLTGRFQHFSEIEKSPRTYKTRENVFLNSGHIDALANRNQGSVGLNLAGSFGNYLKRFLPSGKAVPASYEDVTLDGARQAFIR